MQILHLLDNFKVFLRSIFLNLQQLFLILRTIHFRTFSPRLLSQIYKLELAILLLKHTHQNKCAIYDNLLLKNLNILLLEPDIDDKKRVFFPIY